MVESSLKEIVNKVKKNRKAVIVGIGGAGKELYNYLKILNMNVVEFFDNAEKFEGRTYDGISISKPYNRADELCLYIISVVDISVRKKLIAQLLQLGIPKEQIEIYYMMRDYEFWSGLKPERYDEELKQYYMEVHGCDLNLKNPQKYTEKIFINRIYNLDMLKSQLTDKYKVRDWVKEKIGEEYLTKCYGVWDDAWKIDFDVLPRKFALKANHGSSYNLIVTDKDKIDKDSVCRQFDAWLKEKYGFRFFELHYNAIAPKIICEEYLEGVADSVYDYNIYCFHGKPMYIHCIKGSHKDDGKAAFYDVNWNKLPFNYGGYPRDEENAPKPEKLQEMIKLSEKLCADFEHVRVDWYNLPDGRVLFGEMTFTPWGGCTKFIPEKYDSIFGELI